MTRQRVTTGKGRSTVCDTKSEGGRRCPHVGSPLDRNIHNARRRANRAAQAAAARWADEHLTADDAAAIRAATPAASRTVAADLGVPSHIAQPVEHPPVPRVAMAPVEQYGFPPGDRLRDNPDEDDLFEAGLDSELWAACLSLDQLEALQDYTANDYDLVNGALKRGTQDSLPPEYREQIAHIDAALDMAPRAAEDRTAYRGVRVPADWSPGQIRERIADAFPAGTSITFPMYLSTSLKPAVAEGFARGELPVLFEMRSRAGVNLEPLSDMPGEHEVLFARGTQWRVAGVTTEARTVRSTFDGYITVPTVLVHLVDEGEAQGHAVGDAPGLRPLRERFSTRV